MTWTESGRALREWREQNGWRQVELAERLGTDRSSVAHIEAGRRRPGQDLGHLIERLGGPPAVSWVTDSREEQAVA